MSKRKQKEMSAGVSRNLLVEIGYVKRTDMCGNCDRFRMAEMINDAEALPDRCTANMLWVPVDPLGHCDHHTSTFVQKPEKSEGPIPYTPTGEDKQHNDIGEGFWSRMESEFQRACGPDDRFRFMKERLGDPVSIGPDSRQIFFMAPRKISGSIIR